jgi:hypothetical protein
VDTPIGALRALGRFVRCPLTGSLLLPRRCNEAPYGGFTTTFNPRQIYAFAPWRDVRFGSQADMCSALDDVC